MVVFFIENRLKIDSSYCLGSGTSTSYEWLKAYNGVNNDADSSQGKIESLVLKVISAMTVV